MQKFLWIIIIGCLMIFQNSVSYGIDVSETKPMKKAALVVWNSGTNNRIFKNFPAYRYLRTKLYQRGYLLNTYPEQPIEGSDLVLVVWKEFPNIPPQLKEKSFLWLIETPVSIAHLYQDKYKNQFKKVFTYQKQYVDNQHIFELKIPYYFHSNLFDIDEAVAHKNVLIAQIAGNYYDRRLLYHKRREDSIWLIENTHNQFKLYGKGWSDITNTLSAKGKMEFKSVYGGYIPNKQDAVKPAKFVLAYENSIADDYVSEKIFDVMVGGAVPIYLGAPNITEYVPADCFIDRTQFKSMADLYTYLNTMPDDIYIGYLERIRLFLQKKDSHPKNTLRLMDEWLHQIFADTPNAD